MQKVSKKYKESMKQPLRNRGYIKATVGIIDLDAQNTIQAPKENNDFVYFADNKKLFQGIPVNKVYATAEENFTKVDNSMYFLPKENTTIELYNNGAVSNTLLGSFYINFKSEIGHDIKGLTIDFGEYYPTKLTIEYDNGIKEYENNSRLFAIEDVFTNATFFVITAKEMVNGNSRLRIYELNCGISKTFSNDEVLKYSFKDYVSPITETIPSQDMTLEVDNQSLYYSVDNPESAFSFFELGQEIKVEFGYDIGNGEIEWLPPNTCYLKNWNADDIKAQFNATDIFDYFTSVYNKGEYKPNGITLYDLAIDVLTDAGVVDEREYYIDPYLKSITVYNPMPAVKHSEALQIIANAGRCVLYQDRNKRIRMKASFVPNMTVTANNQTEYSRTDKLLKDIPKQAYAVTSKDFSIVDGSILFMPNNEEFVSDCGYVSNSIADENGNFEENPKITINMDASFTAYGISLNFRNVFPEEFVVTTYYNEEQVQQKNFVNDTEFFVDFEEYDSFDKMEIEFTKGYPNSRIFIDNILINDVTDYRLTRSLDIVNNPVGTKENRVKSISVERVVYKENEETTVVKNEEIKLKHGLTHYDVYFAKPVYDLQVVVENENVTSRIIYNSNYMASIEFNNTAEEEILIEYVVNGREYITDTFNYTSVYYQFGEDIVWKNPLISTTEQAIGLEKWLAEYYLGDVSYNIKWRGDPRTDANDLFYLELKDREDALVRAYEKEINYNGAWQENIKARKVVLSWQ